LQYSKSRDLKPSRPRRDLKPLRPRLAKTRLETETKSRDSITDGECKQGRICNRWFHSKGLSNQCESPIFVYLSRRNVAKRFHYNDEFIMLARETGLGPCITILAQIRPSVNRGNLLTCRGRWGAVDTFVRFQPLPLYFNPKQATNMSHNKATLYTQYHAKS